MPFLQVDHYHIRSKHLTYKLQRVIGAFAGEAGDFEFIGIFAKHINKRAYCRPRSPPPHVVTIRWESQQQGPPSIPSRQSMGAELTIN